MLRARSDTLFHWLPRDILYLLIEHVARMYPDKHEKFEALMLTEPSGEKMTLEEFVHHLDAAEAGWRLNAHH